MNNKNIGIKGEWFFQEKLSELGIPYSFEDDWYDFLVDNKHKVEVKSCRISVKHQLRGELAYRIGRYDFTSEDNRKKFKRDNVWVCFLCRNREDFLIMGFIKYNELPNVRYISLHSLRKHTLLSLDEWIKKIGGNKSG